MEISGGQVANGPQPFGLATIFLEMGATVAPIFCHKKNQDGTLLQNITKISLAEASKTCKMCKFAKGAQSKSLTWPPTFECGPQLFRLGGHLGPYLSSTYFQRCLCVLSASYQ